MSKFVVRQRREMPWSGTAGPRRRRAVGLIGRATSLALLCLIVPRADAQWRVPANCDVPEHNGDCALYGVSMVQLLANPERFDGNHVRVVGYIHFGSDESAIYLHREDQEYHLFKNGSWASLAPGLSFEGCQDAYVVIEGVYRAHNEGRTGMWSGAVTHITRCQRLP